MDFRGATKLFADSDFDGEPIVILEENGDDGEIEQTPKPPTPEPPEPPPPSKKIYVRGVDVEILNERVQIIGKDGKLITENLIDYTRKNILGKYAQIVLMSPMFVSYANQNSYGTKMPRLGTNAGQLALFPLPPLAEQKRIVERLEEILAEVEILAKYERELAKL